GGGGAVARRRAGLSPRGPEAPRRLARDGRQRARPQRGAALGSSQPMPAPRRSQLVVVANRLPVRMVRDRNGSHGVTSPGGLVSALPPALSKEPGAAWVGWSGSAGDAPSPFVHDGIRLVPIPLNRPEIQLFYEGFSNGTLWPLYHDSISAPEFHRTWW